MSIGELVRYDRPLGRVAYLAWGLGLLALKFVIDWAIATVVFGRTWEFQSYLILPTKSLGVQALVGQQDSQFFGTLLVVAVPFLTAGVFLTARRLSDAGLPVALVFLFFIPVVNLLFFLALCLVPTRRPDAVPAVGDDLPPLDALPVHMGRPDERVREAGRYTQASPRWQRLRSAHRRVTRDRKPAEIGLSLVVSVPLTLAVVALSTFGLGNYGWGVFVGAPFCLGFFAVVLYGLNRAQGFLECVGVALLATTLVGVTMLLMAFEGAICLLMAAPIGYTLAFMGALFGFVVQSRPWQMQDTPTLLLALAVALPALMGAESVTAPQPSLIECRTVVEIDAPAEVVWRNVIAFPELPAPEETMFRAGVAYPVRAEIKGHGVGAVRRCVFSTGAFVEPIDVWDEPRCLAFRVTEQPEPMTEWSPFDIHPPHLDNYLVSQRGQFLLTRLPDGRTRLEGTTWYTNRMWPAWYWEMWSDRIIHRIHLRVLEHIKRHSEEETCLAACGR
jgi:hypothetical protein